MRTPGKPPNKKEPRYGQVELYTDGLKKAWHADIHSINTMPGVIFFEAWESRARIGISGGTVVMVDFKQDGKRAEAQISQCTEEYAKDVIFE